MVYGKSDCRRENDTLLLAQKFEQKVLMKHTAIGMTAQRICRWLFHYLLHFGVNSYVKSITQFLDEDAKAHLQQILGENG